MTLPEDRNCESDWRKKLFLIDEFSDCEIIVKTPGYTPTRFPCHKAIISAVSDVFEKMLQYAFQEGLNGKIIIDDNTTPSVMMIVLKYIYMGEVQLMDWSIADAVFATANSYKVTSLIQHCEEFLMEHITLRNVCCILETAVNCNSKTLKDACLEICGEAAFIILNTTSFQEINERSVRAILSLENLNVPDESVVFGAVWKWARCRCCLSGKQINDDNIVEAMVSLLDLIRFGFTSVPNSLQRKAFHKCLKIKSSEIIQESEITQESETIAQGSRSGSNDTAISNNATAVSYVRKRKVVFPLKLDNYKTIISFQRLSSAEASLKGNITLLKFSVDSHSYLLSFSLVCFKGKCTDGNLTSVHISNRKGTVAIFQKFQNDMPKTHLSGTKERSLHSALDSRIYRFEAKSLFLLEAFEEYAIDVNSDDRTQQCDLIWPQVSLKVKHKTEIKLQFYVCYGVKNIAIIQAS